jgi:hypothetical protein
MVRPLRAVLVRVAVVGDAMKLGQVNSTNGVTIFKAEAPVLDL